MTEIVGRGYAAFDRAFRRGEIKPGSTVAVPIQDEVEFYTVARNGQLDIRDRNRGVHSQEATSLLLYRRKWQVTF